MTDLGIIPTVEELFKNVQPWEHFGWLPLGEAQWKMRQIVRATMHRYNLKEVFFFSIDQSGLESTSCDSPVDCRSSPAGR